MEFKDGNIVLRGQEAKNFWLNATQPCKENDEKRYAFFESLEDITVEVVNGNIVCHLNSDEDKARYNEWKEIIGPHDSTN